MLNTFGTSKYQFSLPQQKSPYSQPVVVVAGAAADNLLDYHLPSCAPVVHQPQVSSHRHGDHDAAVLALELALAGLYWTHSCSLHVQGMALDLHFRGLSHAL